MMDRIKNPIFLAAFISFLYNVTNYVTTNFFHIIIDPSAWLTFFQLILWIFLGIGIYANYTPTQTIPTPQPIQYQQPITKEQVASSESNAQTS